MKRCITAVLVVALGIVLAPADGFARGFGGFGGFHGGSFGGGGFHADSFGGGGFHADSFGGGYGGYHAGGFADGGYHADSFSGGGYHADGFGGGYGGYHAGGFADGGYRAGGYGSVNRGQLNSFLGLPTDGGFHAMGGAEGHVYQGFGGTTVAHGAGGIHGAAVGPYGAAAGGRYVSGTAVRGPEGNVYTHETAAGRGYAAYGTHPWSPTYYHAQAVAGRAWCYGNRLYTPGWSALHPWAWSPAGYAAADWATAAWTTANWASLGSWLGYANAEPYSYNYGNSIVYQDGEVYYGNQAAGTAQQYYQEAADLASSTASANAAPDAQWLPLGVFGLMANGKKTPGMVFQLAVDRNGTIRGNYFDQVTQTNLPVTGAVDKKSQRVAWKVASGQGLVVETGLDNLAQNESTALVHFGADRTEQDLLVRIKPPTDDQTASNN
jgi:hypothetical protein